MEKVKTDFALNKEQSRAYYMVVNHFLTATEPPLQLYLAGMAGTGKSRVIHAISAFFVAMGVPDQLLLLAPTGTAAANIGGHTYHSVLGLNPKSGNTHNMKPATRARLSSVRYIFIDEVSMISCSDMKTICERLSL
ncbi:hypothetical protein AURDEDRAFT_74809, partial [Auricularia subglabra TFB-10046 SS5]